MTDLMRFQFLIGLAYKILIYSLTDGTISDGAIKARDEGKLLNCARFYQAHDEYRNTQPK